MLDFPTSPSVGQKFPASPIVGVPTYTWDGEKWTTAAGAIGGKTQVWTDGSAAMTGQLTVLNPPVASTDAAAKGYVDSIVRIKKNYILNGGMRIAQDGGGAGTVAGALVYVVDQFASASNNAGTLSGAQAASLTPGGSPNRLRLTVTAADAAVNTTDFVQIIHDIEGLNVADLKIGTAAAKQVTLQFGVKAPAGTYAVAFSNTNAATRSYVAQYTIAAGEANTDVVKSVTLTLDTAGTWAKDTGIGLEIRFFLMGGTNYQTASPNTWLAGAFYCTSSQTNFMLTNGNVFELFDVGLYEGAAPPAFQLADSIAAELVACQRYYETITYPSVGQIFPSALLFSTFYYHYWQFHVRKRVAPAFGLATSSAWQNVTPTGIGLTVDGVMFNNGANYFWLQGTAGSLAAVASARMS